MELSAQIEQIGFEIFEDFAETLSRSQNLTEFSFAEKGCSSFNRAIYYDKITPSLLKELASRDCNVAFLADCTKEKINAPINKIVFRQAKNESISEKRIISFDLDFKTFCVNFSSMTLNEKFNFAISAAGKFIDLINQNNIPVWLVTYSGNGLHFHFKCNRPIPIANAQTYRLSYQHWCDILALAFKGDFSFDGSCSNSARLMRLPLSTNWKDKSAPIKNVVFLHKPDADASDYFRHKFGDSGPKVRTNIAFAKILAHFNYAKMDTITRKGDQIVCSSPYTSDSSPSFYFHTDKNIYYDFSTGKGGGLYSLIAHLAGLGDNYKSHDIERILDTISGDQKEGADRYSLRSDGVWLNKEVEGAEEGLWLCSPMTVNAMTRSQEGNSWGRVLAFNDQDGVEKFFAMPMEMLAGDGLELRKELLSRGLHVSQNRKARYHLMNYIQSCLPKERLRCVSRIGWHDDAFVLPNKIFFKNEHAESMILQKEGDFAAFRAKGTLKEWQTNVAELCTGNDRLIFALAVAFAPPLLHLMGEESGGFHLIGSSSIGKTLALRVAGSVWGGGGLSGFLRKWRSTINGLESLAQGRCDSLLVLDEIAEISPKDAAMAVYMLANGAGKKRMTKEGTSAPSAEWRIIFLSSGEIGLSNYLARAQEEYHGGQFVRLVEIDADAGQGLGVFNHFGKYKSAALLADSLRNNCARYYGTAIEAYLTELLKMNNREDQLNSCMGGVLASLAPSIKTGQIMRVAKRFGLVAVAGILTARMKILTFSEEQILEAVKACFINWLKSHENSTDFETEKILSQIRQYLQVNGCAYFPEWDGKSNIVFNGKCSGYKIKHDNGSIEWLILNEVFKNEVCKGLDFRKVIRELKNQQLLKIDRSGKSSTPLRLPNFGLVRVYHLTSGIFTKNTPTA